MKLPQLIKRSRHTTRSRQPTWRGRLASLDTKARAWPIAALIATLHVLHGCDSAADPPSAKDHPVMFRASQEGTPLAGVSVSYGGERLGETDAAGVLQTSLHGRDGVVAELSYRCPDGMSPRNGRIQLSLRRVRSLGAAGAAAGAAAAERPLEVALRCRPDQRTAVLVVRTDGHADLPVLVDGQLQAHTDEFGVAHLAWTLQPGQEVQVALDVDGHPNLRPRTSVQTFRMPDEDAIWVHDQRFTRKPVRRVVHKPRPQPRPVPYRLQ